MTATALLFLGLGLIALAAAVWATRHATRQDAVADDGVDIFGGRL